ncbi:MAG: flagellar assembly protein FliW [Opitutaceae bacterium]
MSMKVAVGSTAEQEQWLKPAEFNMPAGIIGFPEARNIELIYNPGELPFMWLRCVENPALNFIVIEPQAVLPGYAFELSDEDAARLDVQSPDDAFVLNIVTFRPNDPEAATVNLIGPIVVNRHTRVGRQIVISNFGEYSARHPLLQAETAGA